MSSIAVSNPQENISKMQKLRALRIFLKMSIVAVLIFSALNFLVFNYYILASVELALVLFTLMLLWLLKKEARYIVIANVFVALVAIGLISVTFFFNKDASSIVWIGLFPIIAFYLFGLKKGLLAHAAYSIVILLLMVFDLHKFAFEFTAKSYITMLSYLVLSGFFVYYYEYTKKESIDLLQKNSFIDQLTQIGNRQMFDDVIVKEVSTSKRYNKPLSIIMVDIDHFKNINDNFGHLVGDTALIEFSQVLTKNIRLSDTISRWGGEEFIIVLPNHTKEDAEQLALKLNKKVDAFDFTKVKNITASFGVTQFLKGDNTTSFLSRLDAALYQAKDEGRNRVVCI